MPSNNYVEIGRLRDIQERIRMDLLPYYLNRRIGFIFISSTKQSKHFFYGRCKMSVEETSKNTNKCMKYYYLHREEILEKRRLKKLEDPDYKAKLEEKEKAKAEKAAEAERRKVERKLKRKEQLDKILAKEATIAELRKKHVEEIRKVEKSLVLP